MGNSKKYEKYGDDAERIALARETRDWSELLTEGVVVKRGNGTIAHVTGQILDARDAEHHISADNAAAIAGHRWKMRQDAKRIGMVLGVASATGIDVSGEREAVIMLTAKLAEIAMSGDARAALQAYEKLMEHTALDEGEKAQSTKSALTIEFKEAQDIYEVFSALGQAIEEKRNEHNEREHEPGPDSGVAGGSVIDGRFHDGDKKDVV